MGKAIGMPNLERPGYERDSGTFATLKRTWKEFSQDNLTDWAAAMTYYGVLALFPALIALVSIVGIVFSPTQITDALNQIAGQLGPASAIETLKGPIEGIASGGSKTGIMLIVGIVAALWSASGYVGAFMRASNIMYEVDEGRPIWKLRPLQMLVTLAMLLLATLAALSVVVSGPVAEAVGGAIGVGDTAVTVWDYAKWPVLVGIVTLMLAILYYASPNAKVGRFKFITLGAVVAVVIWIVASLAFAFYVANFGSYDKTYGTLAGVVVFLVWLWITNVAFLFGAQLNAERERSEQIEKGVEGAERDLRLDERDAPKEKQRKQTA
jgi:membrane protein